MVSTHGSVVPLAMFFPSSSSTWCDQDCSDNPLWVRSVRCACNAAPRPPMGSRGPPGPAPTIDPFPLESMHFGTLRLRWHLSKVAFSQSTASGCYRLLWVASIHFFPFVWESTWTVIKTSAIIKHHQYCHFNINYLKNTLEEKLCCFAKYFIYCKHIVKNI